MAEYIEREVAVKILRDEAKSAYPTPYHIGVYAAARAIDAIHAADVRPVVFCRDCKHRDPEDHKCDCGQLERAWCVFPVDDNYFCAYGIKREES